MKNFMLLMDKVADGAPGGDPPKDPPANPAPGEPPKEGAPPPKAEGDKEVDEFGYEKTKDSPPGDKKQEGNKSKEDPPKEPEKVENPVTGYGDEPEKVEDPPKEPPKDPPPPPTDLEKKLEGMHKSFAEKTKKDIESLGLKDGDVDKYIALKKQEQKDAEDWGRNQQAEAKRQDQIVRAKWHKELKDDPTFGGEKFGLNVTRSEKVLDEYLPELKKELTENKQVLRPSVMRGLARLADALYPDRQVVHGDPPAPEKKEGDKKSDDPLSFYQ